MAHEETGHIHLGSSILHHTENWETKMLKKKKKLKKMEGPEHTETNAGGQGQL